VYWSKINALKYFLEYQKKIITSQSVEQLPISAFRPGKLISKSFLTGTSTIDRVGSQKENKNMPARRL
jgi:hypothetical protein